MQISNRTLKIITTALMVLCLVSLVAWPIIMGERPGPKAAVAVNKAYAVRFAEYIGLIVLFLVLSGVGALMILRRSTAEFKEMQMQNMRELIEATLEQNRKQDVGDSSVD
ncbi:hypothetical protein BH11ARM1_BH11ARM1_13060 [soil metagenome]